MIRTEAEGLGLSVLNGWFHCNPQTLPITCCFGDVITTIFGDRPRGLILAARADVAPTSPLVHLRYTTLISLGSNFGSMIEAASVE